MFSIQNRALSLAITSFGNKFCLKERSRLIKALDNRFYVKFMQLEIGLLTHIQGPKSFYISILACLSLSNAGLEHSRSNLVFEQCRLSDSFIFGML